MKTVGRGRLVVVTTVPQTSLAFQSGISEGT